MTNLLFLTDEELNALRGLVRANETDLPDELVEKITQENGTAGEMIDNLVNRFGQGSTGFFILTQTVNRIFGGSTVLVSGKELDGPTYTSDTDAYAEMCRTETEILARWKAERNES